MVPPGSQSLGIGAGRSPDVLATLRARGRRLAVVSNANGTLHRAFDCLGLTPLVDVMFDSFLEKVEKPDPRFFQIALDRAGASASSTVHVGDIYHVDVIGARAAGITPVLVDAAGLDPTRTARAFARSPSCRCCSTSSRLTAACARSATRRSHAARCVARLPRSL